MDYAAGFEALAANSMSRALRSRRELSLLCLLTSVRAGPADGRAFLYRELVTRTVALAEQQQFSRDHRWHLTSTGSVTKVPYCFDESLQVLPKVARL